jgi:hypothetical protein
MGGQPPLVAALVMKWEEALTMLGVVSVVYVLLVFVILRLGRTLELKLIAVGILTGVFAVWCAQLPGGEGLSIQARPGQPGEVGWSVGAGTAGAPGRIAVLLTLAGIACVFWSRWHLAAAAARPEEVPHG